MLALTAAFALLASPVAAGVPADPPARDREAKERFLELNFSMNGEGMHVSPGLIRRGGAVPAKTYRRRWGLGVEEGRVVGLSSVRYEGMDVGALGCVACHSGRAAGHFVVGLGNKNIDVGRLGRDALAVEKIWKTVGGIGRQKTGEYRRVEASAIAFARLLADRSIGNLTQGLVPVSFIRDWFYRMAGEPRPEGMPRGQVKVPALWGYGAKRPVGQFCDGFGDGVEPGWALAVEITAGQTPEAVREMKSRVEEAEALFSDFLPPPYPFEVRRALASRGQAIFAASCAGCHGAHERTPEGYPVHEAPRLVPWEIVRTDRDRLDGNTPEFIRLVAASPLNDLVRVKNERPAYFAPKLWGIWARFPYLHNGSVPSIRALLAPPSARPRAFSLRDAGEESRFDPAGLGLTLPKAGSREESRLLRRARRGKRDAYDTSRVGHSAEGHGFFTGLPEADKDALIEYLKTL